MTDLTTTKPGAVGAPRISRWLERAMGELLNPHPDVGAKPTDLPAAVREEAQRVLPAVEQHLRTATLDDWHRFLLPMAVLACAPQSREDLAGSIGAIAFALHDMPAACLSVQAQRDGLQRWRYWPKPADLAELLGPEQRRLVGRVRVLRTIATAKAADPREGMTPEQRAAISTALRALGAELAAKGREGGEAAKGRPAHLSGDALRAAREAVGIRVGKAA